MKNTSLIIASICTLALVACGPGRTEQAKIDKAAAEAEKAAKPVAELPPPITSSTVYRCRGGSVLYVDIFGENESAQVRIDDKVSIPVRLTSVDGGPFTSEDGTVSLSGSGDKITATLPEKGSLACNS